MKEIKKEELEKINGGGINATNIYNTLKYGVGRRVIVNDLTRYYIEKAKHIEDPNWNRSC
ncbi:hypothetical protein [Clostridium saccharobutylicum]|uniref:Uncharacterized protein n=1 Tax=Clostridium saccharobutylicum DSM 13864 TaxID=1345695 RepID=U5MS19_CLOSA|nr:hypothetical protein [Clostridium saccharobutylicum]AGX42426.1 hypothetical protein CLSA_c14250 [Clostridium saccharobutylicum DSM 13864]AQR89711.1 hypothetical protein CLOSC_14140 [Clostridium saccharobutylicum]AQR99613.1 hypothetical protein CSACC_14220 [Clostridium saccharobutylicum]AQS09343.1 hypothetical protein CLOBY_14700 [Clostridium saccharobutylicum]AQS13599.1 hypothetical protein CLOSACC_14220 [Clostridium saccharobutylicum]